MKITLKNIAKVKEAEIEINGITVIAGENNTGKSTVGKALYTVFNSLHNINAKISVSRERSTFKVLQNFLTYTDIKETEKILRKLLPCVMHEFGGKRDDFGNRVREVLKSFEQKNSTKFDESAIKETIKYLEEIIDVAVKDLYKITLANNFGLEFKNQINNIFSNKKGEILLTIRSKNLKLDFSAQTVIEVNDGFELTKQVIYIDDPSILEIGALNTESHYYHRHDFYSFFDGWKSNPFFERDFEFLEHKEALQLALFPEIRKNDLIEKAKIKTKLENLESKINPIFGGNVIQDTGGEILYTIANSDTQLSVKNMSAGLKIFAIIKTLLHNGSIEQDGILILDEPEINLHPEWQLVFAEIIVLLQKEFNLHIVINTHSPYFLRAIQVYAGKHEIADKCNYYLAKNEDSVSIIKDVSDDIEKIYQKLAYPLQKLEDERWKDD